MFVKRLLGLAAVTAGVACVSLTSPHASVFAERPRIARVVNVALSWPLPSGVDALAGALLVRDGRPVTQPDLAIARAILRTNPRIAQAYALLLAIATARAAERNALPPEFLAATLLQESAYDVEALSAAGAVGIAQFEPETAAGIGVDPYDPFASIDGAAALLGSYAAAYDGRTPMRMQLRWPPTMPARSRSSVTPESRHIPKRTNTSR